MRGGKMMRRRTEMAVAGALRRAGKWSLCHDAGTFLLFCVGFCRRL
jgi:hypothetical protein